MPYTSGRGLMRSVARIGLPLVALSALTVSITLSTNGSSRDTGVQLETGSSPSAHAGAAEQVVVAGSILAPDGSVELGDYSESPTLVNSDVVSGHRWEAIVGPAPDRSGARCVEIIVDALSGGCVALQRERHEPHIGLSYPVGEMTVLAGWAPKGTETVQVVGPDGVVSSPTHSDTNEGPTSFALVNPVDTGRVQISAYGPYGDLLGTSLDVVLSPQIGRASVRARVF